MRISSGGSVLPVLPVSGNGDFGGTGITLIDRRNGLLLSKLGFSKAGRGTGAVFFG